ncbi:hypothetical protein ACFW04_003964 [Cataglyphis niger]
MSEKHGNDGNDSGIGYSPPNIKFEGERNEKTLPCCFQQLPTTESTNLNYSELIRTETEAFQKRGDVDHVFTDSVKCELCDFKPTRLFQYYHHIIVHCKRTSDSESEIDPAQALNTESLHNGDYSPEEIRSKKKKRRKNVKPKKCKHRDCDFVTTAGSDVTEAKKELWMHMRKNHKYPLVCRLCPFVTEPKHHMVYHWLGDHTKLRPFKCEEPNCTYSCVAKSMLNSHLVRHWNVHQYNCKDCHFKARLLHAMKKHMKEKNHTKVLVLNEDGTQNVTAVIDVYSKKRGPRRSTLAKNQDKSDHSDLNQSSSSTSPEPPQTPISHSEDQQQLQSVESDSNFNSSNNQSNLSMYPSMIHMLRYLNNLITDSILDCGTGNQNSILWNNLICLFNQLFGENMASYLNIEMFDPQNRLDTLFMMQRTINLHIEHLSKINGNNFETINIGAGPSNDRNDANHTDRLSIFNGLEYQPETQNIPTISRASFKTIDSEAGPFDYRKHTNQASTSNKRKAEPEELDDTDNNYFNSNNSNETSSFNKVFNKTSISKELESEPQIQRDKIPNKPLSISKFKITGATRRKSKVQTRFTIEENPGQNKIESFESLMDSQYGLQKESQINGTVNKIIRILEQPDTKLDTMPTSWNASTISDIAAFRKEIFPINSRPSSPYKARISVDGGLLSEVVPIIADKERTATGMAYCGVIGHVARKYFAVIGPPIDKVMKIMSISYDKVSCDYDTVIHSHFKKYQFRSRGVRIFGRLEKFHVYEYLGDKLIRKDAIAPLDYCYPILGRTEELENFNNVLDEIGITNRNYSGILIELVNKICIFLDDIQYMDYMSWQFLSTALNNNNIVMAMTMLKPNAWEDLSHVEVEIYKDKRFMMCALHGLNANLLPTFACQFLNVFGIPRRLNKFLRKSKNGHIGWCEALLTFLLQNNSLDFIKIVPGEAKRHDLIFVDTALVTKLPIDLTPEEVAPPLPWTQMSELDVCVTTENYSKIDDIEPQHDMKEIMLKIYNEMNPYEQSFIKCAATLGKVFKRNILQDVMPNSIPPHTISESIILIPPHYAHCKMLEFKIDLFRSMMYNMQTNEEKQNHHDRAAKIYSLDARKCNSCGNGHFLRVPSKDKFTEEETPMHTPRVSLVRHRTIIEEQNDKFKSGIFSPRVNAKKNDRSEIRRVSVLPSFLDEEEKGELDKVLDFFLEYSAGLIQTAQPLYAIKLLSIATEKNEAIEISKWTNDVEKIITNKGIILALMAYALRSFKLAFSSLGSFLEKSEVYLVTVRVLTLTKNIQLIQYIERPMLAEVKKKINWHKVEEITMLAKIYLMMYQTRALRGELEEAINIGIKVLKISSTLHINKLLLIIVPSLTQIMLWTKRINEAVDLIRELYFLAEEDVDLSDKTWYYALSTEFILDAGVVLDSFEVFHRYYERCVARKDSKFCAWRDPQSLRHLYTCLWLYQLRMGHKVTEEFTRKAEDFIKEVSCDDFPRIFSCVKGLECYLMKLLHCINMKQSDELSDLIQDISKIIKFLKTIFNHAMVIKPRMYLLMAYLNVLRGRRTTTRFYLHKAQKFALLQGNKQIEAWIMQNKRIWMEKMYNNMARYWVEYIESPDFVAWQYIHFFNMNIWSSILYPLPTPDSHL